MSTSAKKLGVNIRKIREEKGMMQVDLCRKLEVDRAYISNIENGNVVEDGTHAALLGKGGKYATLWSMQAGGFLPSEIEEQ
ncbi:MAG: helix-turn-helix domain-containing protein [Candidatus Pacebacteria bacterium]|jgi:ATP-binding cassette subfamily B multidrug efflux pump|nr:helix-turn-helix domain-containing protein [Candidatus Paceibacterota bacterium]